MKKKIFTIVIIVGILFIIGGIVLSFVEPQRTTPEKKLSVKEQAIDASKKAVNDILDSSMTPEKLKDKYNVSVGSEAILVGNHSILREKSSLEKKLTNYAKAQDYYASRVEKKMQDTFSYRLGDYLVADEGKNVIQKLYFKSYYLELYLMDMNALQDMLLSRVGFSAYDKEGDLTDDDLRLMYKAKVKAMEIMDNYLDNYINSEEEIEYDMIYSVNGKELGKLDYYSLVCNVSGIMYNVLTDITVEGSSNYILQQQRIQGYMANVNGTTEQEVLSLNYK